MKRIVGRIAFFVCLVCVSSNLSFGQSSPIVGIGSSGVSFTNGNIDTEILAELIQEKQEELRDRLITNYTRCAVRFS